MKKFFVFGLSLALLVACLAGCAASPRAENAASDKGYYEGVYDSVESTEAERPGENAAGLQNQKLIRTVSVEAETDDLDASLSTLASRISAMGGYVEDQTIRSNASGSRYASMTIRVPVDQMDSFVTYIRDQSNVTYYTESAEDVTLQYVATESRIAALETERERLMDLMAKAEDMSDLLMIEQRLTDVLTELEQVQSQLRVYDNLVDYGTIHLSLSQVKEYTYTTKSGTEETIEFNEETGMVLYLKSGYRSYGTQATTYANYLDRNNNVDDGYVAKPGSSEHQTGLCADILNADYAGRPTMTQDFKWEPEAQWMKDNCDDYGFILRYTEEAEETTGIKFEPWHFRYVGETAAKYIMGKGITLEEFTVEAQAAMEDFLARGGNVEEQLEYEYKKLNVPPASYLLDEFGEDGDVEVSLVF